MPYLTKELLIKFQELIYGRSSLQFGPSRRINLEMQLRERVTATGLFSFHDYYELLQRNTDELQVLINCITTKETYFFRLPAQFDALKKSVLPRIEENLSRELQRRIAEGLIMGSWKPPLRIWSAGCATGEEAYSIAMTVMNGLKYPRAWKVEILATDISEEAIKKASSGYYEGKLIEQIPHEYQKKYISRRNGGGYMSDALQEKIFFRVFNLRNLMDEDDILCTLLNANGLCESVYLRQRFEVIFCRNVMIYFDYAAQKRLVEDLYAYLKPGGYLFTGDAELLHIYEHKFKTVENCGAIFYQKSE